MKRGLIFSGFVLLLLTANVSVNSAMGIENINEYRNLGSISITAGIGGANGLRVGSRYQLDESISGEILLGYGLLGGIRNQNTMMLSSIVNYYLAPFNKGSTTFSWHTGIEFDGNRTNIYLSPSLGYEVQYKYGLNLNFRMGFLGIPRVGYGWNLDVSAGFRF